MFEILHDVNIYAPIDKVFDAISDPKELEKWWPHKCQGRTIIGSKYDFYFSPEYDWKAQLTQLEYSRAIEWKMIKSDPEWEGTKFGFRLSDIQGGVLLSFYHSGWKNTNHHFKRTSYCWAMYLQLLKQYLEEGLIVLFENRKFV